MSKPALTLYFGVYLDGTEDQFELSDTSAGTKIQFRLPAGYYFFSHDEGIKDILNVLNIVFSGYMDNARINDRQLQFKFADPTDTLLLLPTENQDSDKLAELLGLYDNNGNLEYYQGADIVDGTVGQVNMCTWYSASGRVFRSPSERGLFSHLADYYISQSGKTAGISTGHVSAIRDLSFTSIDADDVRVHDLYGTQDTLGTTQNADWTTSLWSAYNPALHAPVFTAEFSDRSGDTYGGEWWITAPIEPGDCTPTNQNYAGLFDLTLSANYLPLQTRDRVLYLHNRLSYGISEDLTTLDFSNEISIMCDFIIVDSGNYKMIFGLNEMTGGGSNYRSPGMIVIDDRTSAVSAFCFYCRDASYNWGRFPFNIGTLASLSGQRLRLVATRKQVGVADNDVNLYNNINGTARNYNYAYTIANHEKYATTREWYTVFAHHERYMFHASVYDRILTATEISDFTNYGITPAPGTSKLFYDFNEYGGQVSLDSSGSGYSMQGVLNQWEDYPL